MFEPSSRTFVSQFPAGARAALVNERTAQIFGKCVVCSVFDWIWHCEEVSVDQTSVSFLELWTGWTVATSHRLPIEDPLTHRWIYPQK